MNLDIANIELKRFSDNPEKVSWYREAKERLLNCGLINLLRGFARPFNLDRGNAISGVYMAAYCEGYNKALDDIIYLEEAYINPQVKAKPVGATFGALSIMMEKNVLNSKEIEEYKNGRKAR